MNLMSCCCHVGRWSPLALLVTIFVVVLALAAGKFKEEPSAPDRGALRSDCPMFGGTPARNMANPHEKNLPTDWTAKEGEQKNVKWVAALGSRGYASPAIAGGRVFISTNNAKPRDPKIKGQKAVLMCFSETDGRFLWQLTHDMPSRD